MPGSSERRPIPIVEKEVPRGESAVVVQSTPPEAGAAAANEDGSFHPSLWAALRRASLRACLKLSEASGRGRTPEELAAHMIPLAESVWRLAQGEEVVRGAAVPALPVITLLDTLRVELLEEFRTLGSRASVSEIVILLQAIETLGERVSADPAHRFASRFLGGAGIDALVEVAHDMRSPLTSIILLVETMRQGQSGPVTKVQERQLGLAYSASLGLSLIVNDIISLARSGERLVDSEPQPFSLSEVLNSVREIVLPMAEEKGIVLRMVLPDGDWRMGFSSALHRVLLNLATNALKFTDAGTVEVAVRSVSRTSVEFSVSDSGRGIPDQLMPSLFDAFRTHAAPGVATFSGSGLGLATCRKLVLAMGSDIQVQNLSEGGSRFFFTIELPPAPRI